MTVKLTILGCGSSAGVPRIGGDWGRCDPSNPKNRRRRCSVLLTRSGPNGVTRVLIDTSPDLREQMLDASVPDIDGVLFTHEHADHTHGIDELRAYFPAAARKVEVWADEPTGQHAHDPLRLLLLYRAWQRLSADPEPEPPAGRNARHHRWSWR